MRPMLKQKVVQALWSSVFVVNSVIHFAALSVEFRLNTPAAKRLIFSQSKSKT